MAQEFETLAKYDSLTEWRSQSLGLLRLELVGMDIWKKAAGQKISFRNLPRGPLESLAKY